MLRTATVHSKHLGPENHFNIIIIENNEVMMGLYFLLYQNNRSKLYCIMLN